MAVMVSDAQVVDPGLDEARIAATLRSHYDLQVASVVELAIDHDANAVPYQVVTADGNSYFLKGRFGPVSEAGLQVPSGLIDQGVPNILAPIRTRSYALWCPLDGDPRSTVVLFPFIQGRNAAAAAMSETQWREFGSTLRAVHDSGLGERFRAQLAVEAFALPSAAKVRRLFARIDGATFESPAAARLADFWRTHGGSIMHVVARAERLGGRLVAWPFDAVLCHGDIHRANVLVCDDGRIFLTDWDGPPEPLLAPRERDLMFIAGSPLGRPVEPHREERFLEGYGPVAINVTALAYFRYERIVQDIGEYGESVFFRGGLDEEIRAREADRLMHIFDQGGPVDFAERASRM